MKLLITVLCSLIFMKGYTQTADSTTSIKVPVNKKSVAFIQKHCAAISTYNWNNPTLNDEIKVAGKKHRRAKGLLISGSVLSAIGISGIVAGIIYKTPPHVNANDGSFNFTKTFLLAGGSSMIVVSLPFHFSGMILHIRSKKLANNLCREF